VLGSKFNAEVIERERSAELTSLDSIHRLCGKIFLRGCCLAAKQQRFEGIEPQHLPREYSPYIQRHSLGNVFEAGNGPSAGKLLGDRCDRAIADSTRHDQLEIA